MAAEQGLEVDREGFTRLMQEQRAPRQGRREVQEGRPRRHRGLDGPAGARRDRLHAATSELTSEATVLGIIVDGERVDELEPGTARPGRARPHPVLRRVRRPDRRRGRHHRRRRAARGRSTCSGRSRASSRTPSRCSRVRCGSAQDVPRRGRRRVAALGAARRTPARTSCTRRCARCSARRPCSPAPTTSPATCGSTSRWGQALSPETRSEIEEVANLAVRDDLPVVARST